MRSDGLRVLMLSHMYPSPVNPTAGIFVHEQVRALRSLGHDVRVVSPKGWAPPLMDRWRAYHAVPGVDVIDGVPVLYPRKLTLPGARLGARNADAMRFAIAGPLRRVHSRWPFDVIHAQMLVPDGWAAAKVGASLGVPVVATAHRADVIDLPSRSPALARQVGDAVASIDQIVTVSRAIRDSAARWGTPRRPIVVVPNGADTSVFQPHDMAEARRRLDLPVEARVVTYVGKLVPRKGVDVLVEAMGRVHSMRPEGAPLLVVAGIGELRESLEARARALGIGDRLRFVGKIAHDDVAWWMAAGEFFVLPSHSEGLPTVCCEALNCGRPVVATAVDGTPEIVRHEETGLLVPAGDAAALADALVRMLDEPGLRDRLAARALEVGQDEFTWLANARQTAECYREVLR
ncbi:MAG: glycosyltransferase family 4 protein [Actinobacteria bacterium]|nr:glycosyltransferase family 4 protein [Actinomycetota bacterium]